jgi:chromosome segregation ATPase
VGQAGKDTKKVILVHLFDLSGLKYPQKNANIDSYIREAKMTQISKLQHEFETAFDVLQNRISAPTVSTAETELTAELDSAKADMSRLEGELEKQQDQYLSLSEEYGTLELSLNKLQEDDTAERENADLTQQLVTLKSTSEETISQMASDNKTLQENLDAASAQSAEAQIALRSAHAAAENAELDQVKQQHANDIADVQAVLKKLKPLVEE